MFNIENFRNSGYSNKGGLNHSTSLKHNNSSNHSTGFNHALHRRGIESKFSTNTPSINNHYEKYNIGKQNNNRYYNNGGFYNHKNHYYRNGYRGYSDYIYGVDYEPIYIVPAINNTNIIIDDNEIKKIINDSNKKDNMLEKNDILEDVLESNSENKDDIIEGFNNDQYEINTFIVIATLLLCVYIFKK